MPIFRNFHLACVAWKYKWAQERTGRARDTRRLIFTEYETILHHTTNHDILPCKKNSEQFQDSRKASNRVHMMILMKEINVDSVAVGGREEFFMTIILYHHDEDDSSSVTVMTVTI